MTTIIKDKLSHIRGYLYSLLFTNDKTYCLKKPIGEALKLRKRLSPERDSILIYSTQLRSFIAVPVSRFSDYLYGHEPNVCNVLRHLLSSETTFIDVGAFIGFYSIFTAKLGAKVIALGPDPRSLKLLYYNIMLNIIERNVSIIGAAAGDYDGSIAIKLSNSWAETSTITSNNKTVDIINVPLIKLDTIIKCYQLRKVDVIKVDVEGSGLNVIKGGLLTIEKFKPHIIFELHKYLTDDELKAVKFLKEHFAYTSYILEYRSKQNFILHLKPS